MLRVVQSTFFGVYGFHTRSEDSETNQSLVGPRVAQRERIFGRIDSQDVEPS